MSTSSAPFILYKELAPASNAHLSAFFTPKARKVSKNDGYEYVGDEYLFTSSTGAISIYRVHHQDEMKSSEEGENVRKGKKVIDAVKEDAFLSLVYHSTLYGKAQDLKVFSPPVQLQHHTIGGSAEEEKEEHLLLSLDSGKFCVLVFDADTVELRALNMFNSQHNATGLGAAAKTKLHGMRNGQMMSFLPNLSITVL